MSETPMRVLVVDDEPPILRTLRAALHGNGYDVRTAADGDDALDQIALYHPDVVILDLVMPGKSGFDVVQEVRTWSPVPIIVLSARGAEGDKVTALDLGADDYVTKPFGISELLARIRVALRHRAGEDDTDPIINLGGISIDLARRVVLRDGEKIHLTPTEWHLLLELTRNAGRVLTHRMLLERIWGPYAAAETQNLRVFVNQLRRKIEPDPARPRLLLTEPGVGYRFAADESP
ncbi:MAG: response regulator [Chloroflexota bacterium]|nr:response regulator [Chloroflexota bacterium]